ncbi:RagB/SusD family nutrient uptake outer membrane protein [Sphingobacterium suaedae]|uniref:RagB/SusD family nutrient uptake outer membrane protein n=1 Tax=Sphingobacterium suaedae TaxID=1686402 RepID=A0ABW5KLH5_9SPHI
MNKIYSKLVMAMLLLITVFIPSCSKNDLVELYPEFELDALTNPSTLDQVEQVLSGAYAGFRDADYFGSASGTGASWVLMPDVMSDNFFESASQSLANSRSMADWLYNESTEQVSLMYTAAYKVIAAANIVIRDADKFREGNELRVNRIKGQAYAIRALAHFDLFRYFAPSFDRSSTNDLAVFYSTEFLVSTDAKPARHTNKEFYDLLFADLDQAKSLLQNTDQEINSGNALSRPFIDLTGVHALQARTYLYAGLWAEAEAAATAAINARPLVNLNQNAFSGMYNQTSAGEIIWNVQFEAGQGGPTYLVYFPNSNRNPFRPSYDIAVGDGSSGLIRENDIRFDAFFKADPDAAEANQLTIKKYQGKGTTLDGVANVNVFRTGEMYLIRAEARARSGQAKEVQGLQDLNTLRAARIAGYTNVNVSGAVLLNEIANERRRELFGEGHRFFDLKRTSRTIQRGAPCGTSVSSSGECSLASSAREWALPYPESVTRANQNIIQNQGYN